jgi:hypothetical protein
MPRQRKIPMRQCTGCLEVRPKREMIRIVRTPEGQIVVDATGKRSGRGAYVCPDPTCLSEADHRSRLAKSLEVSIGSDTWQQLEQAFLDWRPAAPPKR